jgi:hypothetical protein
MSHAEEPDHIRAYHYSSKHRAHIEEGEKCGCFYCLTIFTPSEITRWTDEQQTAVCPHCGVDSVIGSASGFPITSEFLHEMCEYWFASDPQRGDASG